MLSALAEHYSKEYESYTSALSHWYGGTTNNWAVGMQPYVHHFIGPKVLVLGCSIGYEVWALLKHGFDVYGCDFSKAAIDGCKTIGVGDRCRVADVTDLAYPDSSFDTVMGFDVLEHIPIEYLGDGIGHCERVTKSKFIARIPYNPKGASEATGMNEGVIQDHYINQPMEWWKARFLEKFVPMCWDCWVGPDDRFGLENCFFITFTRRREEACI